jgi:tellurium resistance protein TerZ
VNAGALDTGSKTSLILDILFKHPDKGTWHFAKIAEPTSGRHFVGCLNVIRKCVDAVLDPGCLTERTLSIDKTFQMTKGDNFLFPPTMTKLKFGLGWTCNRDLDLDASCLFLKDIDNDGDLDPYKAVYFGNKVEPGVESSGDNRTGAGSGDDEVITVDFSRLEKDVAALAMVVNVFTDGGSFENISESYVRLFDGESGHEYARYTLDARYKKRGMVFCVLYKGQGGEPWSVLSVGEECDGRTAHAIHTTLWDGSLDGSSPSPPSNAAVSNEGCCTVS